MQHVQGGGAVVTTVEDPPPRSKCGQYTCAILTFLTGGGIFILGICIIAVLPNETNVTGIWIGAVISFTGMVGVASTWKCHIRSLKGFYIFLCVISAILSVVSIIAMALSTLVYSAIAFVCQAQDQKLLNEDNCDIRGFAIGVHVTIMLFSGFEFIVAIVGASLACGCCCGGGRTNTVVVAPQPVAVYSK